MKSIAVRRWLTLYSWWCIGGCDSGTAERISNSFSLGMLWTLISSVEREPREPRRCIKYRSRGLSGALLGAIAFMASMPLAAGRAAIEVDDTAAAAACCCVLATSRSACAASCCTRAADASASRRRRQSSASRLMVAFLERARATKGFKLIQCPADGSSMRSPRVRRGNAPRSNDRLDACNETYASVPTTIATLRRARRQSQRHRGPSCSSIRVPPRPFPS